MGDGGGSGRRGWGERVEVGERGWVVVGETFGVEFGEVVGDVGAHGGFLVGVEGFLTC